MRTVERINATPEQRVAIQAAVDGGAVPTHAYWNDGVWVIKYLFPCDQCGKSHAGGGGSGDLPDLALGEVGYWSRDCIGAGLGADVKFVLAEIEVR